MNWVMYQIDFAWHKSPQLFFDASTPTIDRINWPCFETTKAGAPLHGELVGGGTYTASRWDILSFLQGVFQLGD